MSSNVEANVTIMVACMPACAAFGHHYSSNIISRLSHSKAAKSARTGFGNSTDCSNDSSKSQKYWRLKAPFSYAAKRETQSGIRNDIEDAKILQTFEFTLVENKDRAPSPATRYAIHTGQGESPSACRDMV